tara:strand:+ start:66 stop:197 length:132 start_codon:yes stop_codon:yes gene_type:complete
MALRAAESGVQAFYEESVIFSIASATRKKAVISFLLGVKYERT